MFIVEKYFEVCMYALHQQYEYDHSLHMQYEYMQHIVYMCTGTPELKKFVIWFRYFFFGPTPRIPRLTAHHNIIRPIRIYYYVRQ